MVVESSASMKLRMGYFLNPCNPEVVLRQLPLLDILALPLGIDRERYLQHLGAGYWSMIQGIHRASHLALRNVKRIRALNIDTRPQLLPSTSPVRNHCSISQLNRRQFNNTRKSLQARSSQVQPIRLCSQRRVTCRANVDIEANMDVSKGREVLPTNVKPLHYDLTLEPDFAKFSYEGTVVIE